MSLPIFCLRQCVCFLSLSSFFTHLWCICFSLLISYSSPSHSLDFNFMLSHQSFNFSARVPRLDYFLLSFLSSVRCRWNRPHFCSHTHFLSFRFLSFILNFLINILRMHWLVPPLALPLLFPRFNCVPFLRLWHRAHKSVSTSLYFHGDCVFLSSPSFLYRRYSIHLLFLRLVFLVLIEFVIFFINFTLELGNNWSTV